MAAELDPERLGLLEQLRNYVVPWIISKAFDVPEISHGVDTFGADQDELRTAAARSDQLVTTSGPEFEAIYRLAVGQDGRIDHSRLDKELQRRQWPIHWGVFYETKQPSRREPRSLYEALSQWCTAVLRDGVMPEMRRVINAQIADEFATTLRIGAVPGLLHANDISFAVRTQSTKRFNAAVARTHGNGAIGLAGPRGSGKTTLIQQYIGGLRSRGALPPLAIAVACPVHYEARDFVLHLHATLCRAVLERAEGKKINRPQPRKTDRFALIRYWFSAVVRFLCVLAVGAAALIPVAPVDVKRPIVPQLLHPANQYQWWMFPLLVVTGYVVAYLASVILRAARLVVKLAANLPIVNVSSLFEWNAYPFGRNDQETGLQGLAEAARGHLRQIRLLQTSTTGWSGKLTLPLGSEASATKSIQLAERPLTYPEVVDAFRDFIEHCVEVLGSVVIAIDEVDKISSTERAQAFINDVKGIFGVPGCLYLVSISEEAVITFERSGLGIRDAFDSAFDEIVPVEYLDLADSLELLRTRVIGISEPFGFLCHCLSGGLPRELIRAVRRIAEHRADKISLSAMCDELVRDELAVRANEFRIVANRLDVQHGTAVLEPLVHMSRRVSAKDLLDLTTSLIRRRTSDAIPQALDRLRNEAAMLAYHSATMRQVFTDDLDEAMARRARDDAAFPGSFDQLGRARKAVTEDPHLAGLLLDEFRHAWGLPTVTGR